MRECSFEEMVQEHDLRYIWKCPQCGYEYEAPPDCNENLLCPDCGTRCVKSGESYSC